VPDLPEAAETVRSQLKAGALGIGEQKFNVDCDSAELHRLAEVAAELGVPVLMHFQDQMYNKNIQNLHKTLEKFPKVNFIGHAQTFWAHIDRNYTNSRDLYPKGKVMPGGLTDRLLSDYPKLWADISAGSGLNSLVRDEEHAKGFLERHQDKIMFGSDCNDVVGRGPTCQGWLTIHTIRRLAPNRQIERKILYENAKKMFRL
jgi:predicted TIM-barrel fold metal-dependent hydrolase